MKRLVLALALAAAGAPLGCSHDNLDVAPNVDIQRFQGQWFEVAKLPRPTQADCTGTRATYTVTGANEVQVVNECHVGGLTGAVRSVRARASIPDPSVQAKLSLDFGGGNYGDYWIIDVGADYEYAVVGHPTRAYLWILSRTPTLDPKTLEGILKRAQDKKFDTAKLEYTVQK